MAKLLPGLPIYTGKVKSPEDAVRILNRLQPSLQLLARAVDFGPVPGQYFPFSFTERVGAHATALDGQLSLVEFRPIALTLWVDAGEVTIDINADGSSILTAPLATSSSTGKLASKGDFSVDKVDRDALLTLDIDSIDSGTPTKLRAVLWASQIGDIFDA